MSADCFERRLAKMYIILTYARVSMHYLKPLVSLVCTRTIEVN